MINPFSSCLPIRRRKDSEATPNSDGASQPARAAAERPGRTAREDTRAELAPHSNIGASTSQALALAPRANCPRKPALGTAASVGNESSPVAATKTAQQGHDWIEGRAAALDAKRMQATNYNLTSNFAFHTQQALNLAEKRQAANFNTTMQDSMGLDKLLEVEEHRNPGLSCKTYKDIDDFVDALPTSGGKPSERAILQLTTTDPDISSIHHVMADIRRHPDGEMTVVLLEPSSVVEDHAEGLGVLAKKVHEKCDESGTTKPPRFGVIEVGVQKSSYDCAMFSLNFAVKSHKNKKHFDVLHNNLLSSGKLSGSQVSDPKTTLHISSRTEPMSKEEETLFTRSDVDVASALKTLPDDFFKHTHSETVAHLAQVTHGAERRAAGFQHADGRVGSARDGVVETLPQRVARLKAERSIEPEGSGPGSRGPGKVVEASVSIEGYRLQELNRAFEFQQLGKDMGRSKSSTIMNPKKADSSDQP